MRHKKILSRKGMLSQYVRRADIKSSGKVNFSSPIYMDAPTTIESILQFNKIKVDGKSGDGDGSAPPPPPTSCILDVVIAVDLSGSVGGPWASSHSWYGTLGEPYEAERKLLENIIDYLTPGMIAGEIQVGVVFWATQNWMEFNPDGYSMSTNHLGDLCTENTPNHPLAIQNVLPNGNVEWHSAIAKTMRDCFSNSANPPYNIGGGTNVPAAQRGIFQLGSSTHQVDPGVLTRKLTSDLASQYPARENDPDFAQVGIVITDSTAVPGIFAQQNGCNWQSITLSPNQPYYTASGYPLQLGGPDNQFALGVVALDGDFASLPLTGGGSQENVKETLDALTCGQNAGTNGWNTSTVYGKFGFYVDINNPASITNVGAAIVSTSCDPIPGESYNCNNSYSATTFPSPIGTVAPWDCYDPLDGTGQYTDALYGGNPGDGLAACNTNCVEPTSWECSGASGFTSTNPNYPVGTIPRWTCYDPLDGSGSYGFGTAGSNACAAACIIPETYSCSGPNGVSLAAWTPPHPIFGMNIPKWECFDAGMGTGHFTGINALTNCETVCVEPSWDCDPVNFNCYDPGTGNGQWNSTNGGLLACEAACYPETWKCHIPWHATVGTCTLGFHSPPEHATWTGCMDVCKEHLLDIELTGDVSWNCEWTWVGSNNQGGLVGNCNSVTGSSGTYTIKQNCLDACKEVVIDTHADSWDCHIPWKQTVGHCHLKTDGTGAWSDKQDCIDACVDLEAFIVTEFVEVPCDNDIKTCPCGWDYDINAVGGVGIPPGEKWCKNPDFDWFNDPVNYAYIGTFGAGPWNAAQPPFILKCSDLLDHHWMNSDPGYPMGTPAPFNPTIGMTVEGSGTSPGIPGGFGVTYDMAGSITWPFPSAPSYNADGLIEWDHNVIVEINPGSLPSEADPNIQIHASAGWSGGVLTPKACVPQAGIGWPPLSYLCETTLACPCGTTPVPEPINTWGWKCVKTFNTTQGQVTFLRPPYRVPCHHIGGVLPSVAGAGGITSYCLDQYVSHGSSTSWTIPSTGGQVFSWDKATVFDIQPPGLLGLGGYTLANVQAMMAAHFPPPGWEYVNSVNTSASGCSQPC